MTSALFGAAGVATVISNESSGAICDFFNDSTGTATFSSATYSFDEVSTFPEPNKPSDGTAWLISRFVEFLYIEASFRSARFYEDVITLIRK